MAKQGRRDANTNGNSPPEKFEFFLPDDADLDLIAVMAAEAVMEDERNGDLLLCPADAMVAIRQFDLTGFDWAPKDRQEFRRFLGRYVPQSLLQSILQFDETQFDDFLNAWEPGSTWCPIFMHMVGLARFGAVRAYMALLAEAEALPPSKGRTGSLLTKHALQSQAPRHKGPKTVQ